MAKVRHCKDCPANVKRPCPHPGPRCTTHHRAITKLRKANFHEASVIKKYGIEAGEYEVRYKAQGGKCAICQFATGASKRLAVDHNHSTGAVRGLLCSPCNRFVGRLRDSSDAFLRAYKYLRGELEFNG